MLMLKERPQVDEQAILRHINALPEIALDSERYRSIGFLRAVQMAVRKHGPVLYLNFGKGDYKVLLGEARFSDCWRRNSRALVKDVDEYPAPASLARMILDNNLTTAREGEEWEGMRTQFSPLMRYKMTSYSDAVTEAAEQMRKSLLRTEADRPSLWAICGRWSAMTVAHPVLGFGFSDQMVLDMVNALRECMFHLVQASSTTEREALIADAILVEMRDRLKDMITQAILQCKAGDDTMVGILLDQQNHPRGTPPTQEIITILQPVLVGALAATVHNNSLGMFWTLLKLAQNPDVADQVAAEENAQSPDAPFHLNAAPIALSAVREALRITPVLPFIERKAATDLVLDDIVIPKGTTVIFSPWLVQRSPENWEDPLTYDIRRFDTDARLDMTKWFPFGLGHRACVGNNLALNQLSFTIGKICSALHLALPDVTRPSYWQPSYRVLLEPHEDGGIFDVTPRKMRPVFNPT